MSASQSYRGGKNSKFYSSADTSNARGAKFEKRGAKEKKAFLLNKSSDQDNIDHIFGYDVLNEREDARVIEKLGWLLNMQPGLRVNKDIGREMSCVDYYFMEDVCLVVFVDCRVVVCLRCISFISLIFMLV